ncbi:integumentary mucin C.1-like isoform X8 [Littorina saxatilis]|uniref:integumentary mucin C.1-like isoform X8 n=1 Tax=Littorina saxatilis TaxID=31220 RepID=UPI0038B5505F
MKSVSPAKLRMGSLPVVCHAVLFFSFIVCVGGACTWADKTKTAGAQGQRSGQLVQFVPGSSLDDCKALCDAQAGCVAVDSTLVECFWFSVIPPTSAVSSTTHSVKTCTAATTTDSTTTSTVTATTTNPTTSTIKDTTTTTSGLTSTAETATSPTPTTTVTTSSQTTSTSPTPAAITTTTAPAARGACTWADKTKTAGAQGQRSGSLVQFVPGSSLDDCKALCDAQAGCVAVDWTLVQCFWFSVIPPTSAVSSTTHSVKTCTAATTTDSTTTSTVTATTTNPTTSTIKAAECTFTEKEDTRVTSTAQVTVDLSSSGDCETLCKDIPQCRAYSSTSGKCEIHTSDDTPTSTNANYVHATKINCFGNGEPCCFSQVQTATKGTAGSTHSLIPTLDSCKSMCSAVSSCQGLTFSSSTCYFYASTPSTATQSGSFYYTKTCADGADTGSLTISVCGSAAMPQLSKVLVAWILAVTLLTT